MKNINNSKYYKLIEYLRDEMLSGRIMPGEKIPSENTLAEKFSYSRHTIRKSISMLVNEGLLYTEQGRGTFSSGALRKSRDSRNIGVITTYISEYIFPQVINGIDEILSQNGYSIILKNTGNDCSKEASCLKDIIGKDIAGLIIEPTRSAVFNQNDKIYNTLDQYGIPYVFIHGYYEQLGQKPSVILDDAGGLYELVMHLTSTGHRNICGIFKADDIQGLNRHKGYVKALSDSGLNYDPEKVIWYHTEDRSTKPYAAIQSLFSKNFALDAVACYNDEIACKMIDFLKHKGYRVPEDISVTGFDDSYLSTANSIKLTTARHPKEELGREAASLILDLISGTQPRQILKIIKPEIILRNSTIKK